MKTRRTFESASVAMFKSASVAMATAVAISAPLYAARDTPATDQPNPAFQKLDTDRGGYISKKVPCCFPALSTTCNRHAVRRRSQRRSQA